VSSVEFTVSVNAPEPLAASGSDAVLRLKLPPGSPVTAMVQVSAVPVAVTVRGNVQVPTQSGW
jgi:hypothetical protein